jgi:hypothetical protein
MCRRSGTALWAQVAITFGAYRNDPSQMGACLSGRFDHRGLIGIHGRIHRIGGHRPCPVLHILGDFRRTSRFRTDHLPSLIEAALFYDCCCSTFDLIGTKMVKLTPSGFISAQRLNSPSEQRRGVPQKRFARSAMPRVPFSFRHLQESKRQAGCA